MFRRYYSYSVRLQEGGEGAFDIEFSLAAELEEDTAGSSASHVLDFIMPVAMVFAMGGRWTSLG